MGALEMRQEMLELIKNEEDSSLRSLYDVIKAYKNQRHLDKMIAEGEEDIKNANLYSQSEMQKMIESWAR